MSWNINFVGTVTKVAVAMTAQSEKFTDGSKEEYDKALPLMLGIVNQNSRPAGQDFLISVVASGHMYPVSNSEGLATEFVSSLQVEVKQLFGECKI